MNLVVQGVPLQQIKSGDQLPRREFTPSNVQLMLYNAALWNGHRIHFDEPYTKEVEGYPGLVIAGPLLGDWLHQCVEEWLADDGMLVSMQYSNRSATYIGDTLVVGGEVRTVDLASAEIVIDMFVHNEAGENVAPGLAKVKVAPLTGVVDG